MEIDTPPHIQLRGEKPVVYKSTLLCISVGFLNRTQDGQQSAHSGLRILSEPRLIATHSDWPRCKIIPTMPNSLKAIQGQHQKLTQVHFESVFPPAVFKQTPLCLLPSQYCADGLPLGIRSPSSCHSFN